LDTGIFDGNRYFDLFVEYAKASPEDILIRLTVANRGSEEAPIHLLPTLWFRNSWSWKGGYEEKLGKPSIQQVDELLALPCHVAAEKFVTHTHSRRFLIIIDEKALYSCFSCQICGFRSLQLTPDDRDPSHCHPSFLNLKMQLSL
jgi:hypothetical protein